jgi:hypothetical protein
MTVVEAGIEDLDHNVITGSIEVREQFHIWWAVKNLGEVKSGVYDTWLYIPVGNELKFLNAPTWVYDYKEKIIFKGNEKDQLEPGQSTSWYMTWSNYFLKEGSFAFRVVVNPSNYMKESNFDNNEYSFTVNVGLAETTTKITYSTSPSTFSTPSTTGATTTTTTQMIVTTETIAVSAGWSQDILYIAVVIVAIAAIAAVFFFLRRKRPPSLGPSSLPSTGVKYCVQCGKQLEASVQFCNKCGAKQ